MSDLCKLLLNLTCFFHFLIRSVVVQPKFLFIALLSQRVWTLQEQPTLECFSDGLRLYFEPEKPFCGHIYVKGYFMHEKCHLDFTQNPIVSPFYFSILYKSACIQKCEVQKEPPSINYNTVIIVQHHYLFLTQADRAFSVNCSYETGHDSLSKNIEINGGLATTDLENRIVTNCVYEILMDSVDGQPVKYANVGDQLVHKWSCASEEYGMLIHSCFVHTPDNATFQFIDGQGCITDQTLMDPLTYSDNLTVAHSVVPAFKFADQLIIQFQCKVTLCVKAGNSCENISPPNCEIASSLTSISLLTSTLQSTDSAICNDDFNASEPNCSATSDVEHMSYRRKRFLNESQMTINSLSLTKANSTNANRFTLDVHADQLVIFERNEINQTRSARVPHVSCEAIRNAILLQIAVFILFGGLLLTIIFMQKIYYSKHITKSCFVPTSEKYVQRWQIL
uniref:ZP domain-containing protein n=1 Tax=Wuchereria bancrofti TaxID=6293 RepID=A0AAF5PYE0_WUCBA